jgi:hypothetical protein
MNGPGLSGSRIAQGFCTAAIPKEKASGCGRLSRFHQAGAICRTTCGDDSHERIVLDFSPPHPTQQ